jgi:predicted RNA-binding Zn ribbon-like protein
MLASRHDGVVHWVEFDGVRLPQRWGGHVALDFCNTWAGWRQPPAPGREYLSSYDVLVAWARYADLVDPLVAKRLTNAARRDAQAARGVLADARRLRTAIHDAALDPADSGALAAVSRYARRAGAQARLRPGRSGHATWELSPSTGMDRPVLEVARHAAALLTSPEVLKVGACPGNDCGWLFLNPHGRRRWCSMQACGNRAKVAAFARRRPRA